MNWGAINDKKSLCVLNVGAESGLWLAGVRVEWSVSRALCTVLPSRLLPRDQGIQHSWWEQVRRRYPHLTNEDIAACYCDFVEKPRKYSL